MRVLITAAVATALAAFFLVRARWWPLGPCWACRGRAGRGWGSMKGSYNSCHFCGGSGRRIRPLAKVYRKWREEARKGK